MFTPSNTSLKTLTAFTLVELVVVITILWVLSTIGFISYTSYLGSARDSNRISQLVKISDSLQVYNTQKSLPLPDDLVSITATGVVLGYQWYLWENVLEIINYTNGGKDPKDDEYYTYNVTKNRKYFQLTAFLEDNIAWNATSQNEVYAADYQDRYPKSYGKKIWMYMDEQNTPIQTVASIASVWELDIYSTNDIYTVYFNENESLTWDGEILRGSIAGGWLVAYLNFEELVSNSFEDMSKNNAIWVASWWISVDSDGVIWNSANFDWVDDRYLIDLIEGIWGNRSSPHSISAWIKPAVLPWDCGGDNTCREWILLLGQYIQPDFSLTWRWTHHWIVWWIDGPAQFWIWSWPQKVPLLKSWEWQHIAVSFDGDIYKLYLNGSTSTTKSRERKNTEMNIKNSQLYLWWIWAEVNYNWKIDELRIYRKALDYSEIQNIYNIEKGMLWF